MELSLTSVPISTAAPKDYDRMIRNCESVSFEFAETPPVTAYVAVLYIVTGLGRVMQAQQYSVWDTLADHSPVHLYTNIAADNSLIVPVSSKCGYSAKQTCIHMGIMSSNPLFVNTRATDNDTYTLPFLFLEHKHNTRF